jgi:hypothetical protein
MKHSFLYLQETIYMGLSPSRTGSTFKIAMSTKLKSSYNLNKINNVRELQLINFYRTKSMFQRRFHCFPFCEPE